MIPAIRSVERGELMRLISLAPHVSLNEYQDKVLDNCLSISQSIYAGLIGGQVACAWGLIPPTFLSNQAYLWLYSTSLVEDNKFLFVRHSQRMVEQMLEEYPTLVGYTDVKNVRAIRWIKWLGGEFSEGDSERLNFCIRKKDGRSD